MKLLCGFILLALFNNVFAETWHSIYFCPGGKASFNWDKTVAIEYCQFGGALERGIDVHPLHARVDINSGFSKISASLISPRVEFVGNLSSGDWNFTLKNISKADGKNYSLSCQERNKSPRRIFFNLIARPKENCTKTSVTDSKPTQEAITIDTNKNKVVNDTRVNTTSIPVVNDTRVNTTSIPKPKKPTGPTDDLIIIIIAIIVVLSVIGLTVFVVIKCKQRNKRRRPKNENKSLEEGSDDGNNCKITILRDQSDTENDVPGDVDNEQDAYMPNEQRNKRRIPKNENKSLEQGSDDGYDYHEIPKLRDQSDKGNDVPEDVDNEQDAYMPNEQRNERLKNKNKSEQLSGDGNNCEITILRETENDEPGNLANEQRNRTQRHGNVQIIEDEMADELRTGDEIRAEPFLDIQPENVGEPWTPNEL